MLVLEIGAIEEDIRDHHIMLQTNGGTEQKLLVYARETSDKIEKSFELIRLIP